MGIGVLDHLHPDGHAVRQPEGDGPPGVTGDGISAILRPGSAVRARADPACGQPMDKILYLDCFSGASGDMVLGALIDLGVPIDKVRAAVAALVPPTAN